MENSMETGWQSSAYSCRVQCSQTTRVPSNQIAHSSDTAGAELEGWNWMEVALRTVRELDCSTRATIAPLLHFDHPGSTWEIALCLLPALHVYL